MGQALRLDRTGVGVVGWMCRVGLGGGWVRSSGASRFDDQGEWVGHVERWMMVIWVGRCVAWEVWGVGNLVTLCWECTYSLGRSRRDARSGNR